MATIKGGDKLARALADIGAKLGQHPTLRAGFLAGATYPDGTSVPMVAAIQEFGAPSRNIPPRPFFRQMIAAKSGEWPDTVKRALLAKDYDAAAALALTGEVIRGELQDSIRSFSGVPLAPSTVKAKGFDKALVDTGTMLNSVDYEVKE